MMMTTAATNHALNRVIRLVVKVATDEIAFQLV